MSNLDEIRHTFYFGPNEFGPNGFGPYEVNLVNSSCLGRITSGSEEVGGKVGLNALISDCGT